MKYVGFYFLFLGEKELLNVLEQNWNTKQGIVPKYGILYIYTFYIQFFNKLNILKLPFVFGFRKKTRKLIFL